MATATVSIVSQTIEVTGVGDVVLTDPVQDVEGGGGWVREFRVYSQADDGGPGTLIHTTRVVGDLRTDIEITTPVLQL